MNLQSLTRRAQSMTTLGLLLGILFFVNILSVFIYTQFDLTEDKRYTLQSATEKVLSTIDEPIVVEVYLEGDFPAMFKRLQTATLETLEEFKSINNNVEFHFMNPLKGTPEEVKGRQLQLKEQGYLPIQLNSGGTGESKVQLVYPFARILYKQRPPVRVNLLENKIAGASQEQIINNSISLMEYKLINGIRRHLDARKPLVALTVGHGELDTLQNIELRRALIDYCDLIPLDLSKRPSINFYGKDTTLKVDVLIVAKPRFGFTEQEKFKLDQYVMTGGKILWLLDGMNAEMDSLKGGGSNAFVPQDYQLNLEDQLFSYGARVNPNLLLDLQSSKIPVVTGVADDKPQTQLYKWWYFPIAFAPSGLKHPITQSLDGIDTRFPSSVDSVKTKNYIKKTVLLSSSKYGRVQFSPVRVSFEILGIDVQPEKWNKGNQPIALLLEGKFSSPFQNRVSPQMDSLFRDVLKMPIQYTSVPTKMIVVGDGDIAKNDIDMRNGEAMPLGFNRFENYTFGNKDFLVNCIDYLLDDSGVITARSKDFKLRLLDKVKIKEERAYWQFINLGLPILLLAAFGFGFNFWRKRRYGKVA